MIKCPTCQHVNKEDTKLCEKCGKPITIKAGVVGGTTFLGDKVDDSKVMSGYGSKTFQKAWNLVIHIESVKKPLIVELGAKSTIGRIGDPNSAKPDIDLTSYDAATKGVSRLHAEFLRRKDMLMIVDLESANGTRINGRKLDPNEPEVLRDGDTIQLSKLKMHIYFGKN